jgi:hypothetical protein
MEIKGKMPFKNQEKNTFKKIQKNKCEGKI